MYVCTRVRETCSWLRLHMRVCTCVCLRFMKRKYIHIHTYINSETSICILKYTCIIPTHACERMYPLTAASKCQARQIEPSEHRWSGLGIVGIEGWLWRNENWFLLFECAYWSVDGYVALLLVNRQLCRAATGRWRGVSVCYWSIDGYIGHRSSYHLQSYQ